MVEHAVCPCSGALLLVVPSLAAAGSDGVDGTTLKWLLKVALRQRQKEEKEKEEEAKKQVAESLKRKERLMDDASSSSERKKKKKRKKRLLRASPLPRQVSGCRLTSARRLDFSGRRRCLVRPWIHAASVPVPCNCPHFPRRYAWLDSGYMTRQLWRRREALSLANVFTYILTFEFVC